MDSVSTFHHILEYQRAWSTLSTLHLVSYLWPRPAVVNDGDSFDFIIIGASTAGSVIANRLTENENINVLVIEAGGEPPFESDLPGTVIYLKRSQYDWNYTSVNDHYADQCHQKCNFEMSPGKMLGGTSSLGYMTYCRGHPSDYDGWAKITNDSTWKWENVLNDFIKSERLEIPEVITAFKRYHGTDGYFGITKAIHANITDYFKAFSELGNDIVIDFNPDTPLGYTSLQCTISGTHRQSTAISFLSTARNRPNLHVLRNTFATRAIFEGNRAIGVEAITKDGEIIKVWATKEVIVSAGAFNSPKFLMLSGIGPKEHLQCLNIDVRKDLPVGTNLQEHIGVIIIHNMQHLTKPLLSIDPRYYPSRSFRGNVALNKTQGYPDYHTINYACDAGESLYFSSFAYRFKHALNDAIYNSGKDRLNVYNIITNLAPRSRGKVLLRSTDPTAHPLIYTRTFSNDEDLENLVTYIQHFMRVSNTEYYRSVNAEFADPKPIQCRQFEFGTRAYWKCYALCMSTGLSHFCGTCAMGSVVDSKLKVLGFEGLRVADASVMPVITRAEPMATVIMIGEKVASFIKGDYGL